MDQEQEKNIAVVMELNTVVNERRYDDMDRLFSPTFTDHNASWPSTSVDELKRVLALAQQQFDIRNEILDVIASGDKVAIRLVSHGVHKSEAFGVPPSGKQTQMESMEIYRFEQGKIAERWVLSDLIGLMAQLGISIPSAPSN